MQISSNNYMSLFDNYFDFFSAYCMMGDENENTNS